MNEALINDLRAYKRARLLATATKLGLLAALQDAALSAQELAVRCNTNPDYTVCLANFLTHLGLLTCGEGIYSLTSAGRHAVLDPTFTAFASYHFHCFEAWEALPRLCTGSMPSSGFHRRRSKERDFSQAYLSAMHAIALASLPWLLDNYGHFLKDRLLDVGAGPATLSRKLAELGQADVTAIDLPNMIATARRMFKRPRRGFRWTEGDFRDYQPRRLYDVVYCSHVMEYCPARDTQDWLARLAGCAHDEAVLVFVVFLRESGDEKSLLDLDLFEVSTGVNGDVLGHIWSRGEFSTVLFDAGLVAQEFRKVPSGPSYGETVVMCRKKR